MRVGGTFFVLHTKMSFCQIDQITVFTQKYGNFCILMYQLAQLRSVISTITFHLGHQKMSYEPIRLLLGVAGKYKLRDRKISVSAPLYVFSRWSIGKCLLYFNKSNSTLRYWKFLVSVGRLILDVLFTIIHLGRMKTDVFR